MCQGIERREESTTINKLKAGSNNGYNESVNGQVYTCAGASADDDLNEMFTPPISR